MRALFSGWNGQEGAAAQPAQVPPHVAPSGVLGRCVQAVVRRYTGRNERLNLCETISLGGRRSIALIECDGQRFLAGMSAGAVETLVAVDAPAPRGGER